MPVLFRMHSRLRIGSAVAAAAFSLSCSASVAPSEVSEYGSIVIRSPGAPAPTLAELEKAVTIYGQDGQIWNQLATARFTAKDYDGAISGYRKALELGALQANFKAICEYNTACAYALKGDKEAAYKWLNTSVDHGFRNLAGLRVDTDLNTLHSDPRWETLAATKDVSKLDRNAGWRYDLWFLNRELRRIHFDPYRYHSKKDQDEWVSKLDSSIPKMSDNEIRVAFMETFARYGDGHTSIGLTNMHQPGQVASVAPQKPWMTPLQFFSFQEGVYVLAAASEYKDLLGAQVLEVGGKPVADVLASAEKIISKDNPQGLLSNIARVLGSSAVLGGLHAIPSDEVVPMKFRKSDGTVVDVALKPVGNFDVATAVRMHSTGEEPLYLRHREKPYWFEYLPESKTVYFQYNGVRNDPSENTTQFAKRMFDFITANDVERLVVDARWNGGGNSFLNLPLVNGIISSPKVNSQGHLFVVIGRSTFSAAQNFVTDIGRSCQPIFVGEPSGSRPNFVGESVQIALPYSGMRGSISDLYWQRSWPMDERIWIAPQLPAPPTFAAYAAGSDPAMDAIRNYLASGSTEH